MLTFVVIKSTMKLSGVSIFPENRGENLKLNVALVFESKLPSRSETTVMKKLFLCVYFGICS